MLDCCQTILMYYSECKMLFFLLFTSLLLFSASNCCRGATILPSHGPTNDIAIFVLLALAIDSKFSQATIMIRPIPLDVPYALVKIMDEQIKKLY